MLTVPKAQESKSKAPGEDLVWRCAFSCVLMAWKEIPSGAQCGTQGTFVYKCKSSVQEEAQVFVLTFFFAFHFLFHFNVGQNSSRSSSTAIKLLLS